MNSIKPTRNRRVNLKTAFIGIASLLMVISMLSVTLSAGVSYSGLPKVNEILYKAYPGAGPDAIVDDFLLGRTDLIDGPGRKDLYDRVIAAGEKVSPKDPMAKFDFIAINCRDLKLTSHAVNLPLNDSYFRVSLEYIYGVNDKQVDIFNYVQADWTFAIDNPVPPAQMPWIDDTIHMPNTNYAQAWSILSDIKTSNVIIQDFSFQPQSLTIFRGDTIVWTNNDPVIHTLWFVHVENKSTYLMSDPILPGESWSHKFNDLAGLKYYCFDNLWINGSIIVAQQTRYWVYNNWLYKGTTQLRNMQVYYPTGNLYWSQGPGAGFVRNFNNFISYIGAAGPTMTLMPISYSALVTDLMTTRNYDFICYSITDLRRYADWLYDLLYSANDVAGGWNFAGIHDALLDQWTMSVLTDLNVDTVITSASFVQARFVYTLMPWFPISSGKAFCTVAHDSRGELMDVESMPNYGPMNDWSWMTMHWKTSWPGGSVRVALADTVGTLNPYTDSTPYGWQMLDRAITDLLSINPVTLMDMPYIATQWSITPWINVPELGIIGGTKVTFYLRQDVLWHDLTSVTAYDCTNNMRLLRTYQPGIYSSAWANLVYEEADGPYKFDVYFSTTSLYCADHVAETALLAPKRVTDKAEAKYGSIVTGWDPAFNTYKSLMWQDPPAKYSFMKQVVGCGPYVFDYFDKSLQVGRVQKFDEFFVSAPAIGSVVGEWRINPGAAYMYKVLVQNVAAKTNDMNGELTDMTVGIKVYEDSMLMHAINSVNLPAWDYAYLGPYTTVVNTNGLHHITVEVYESGNLIHTYSHRYYRVPREDITTYSGSLEDCFIDVKDILRCALGYGAYPGSLRWDPPCDVNDDYFIDIKDILAVALKFGWSGIPPP
jgi:plastocyanin